MTEQDEEKLVELHAETGWGAPKLSESTGISRSAVGRWLHRERKKALTGHAHGYDGHDKPQPVGFCVDKTTVQYDKKGDIVQQWVKSKQERENTLELLQLAAESITEDVQGKSLKVKPPTACNSDLMAVYPIADAHMGLYAWEEETGEDFDSDKCERILTGCMEYLVNAAPQAETCLIPNLADFFHADTMENKTMRSGNILDVDSRWARVFQIGVRCYRNMINLALAKHKTVIVKSGIGNHDDHSIFSLAMLMKAYFENNPRVTIELPINPFSYHEFGKNLIGINHGEVKPSKLVMLMAQDQHEAWGRTLFRTWYIGHFHTKAVEEFPGCTIERFRQPSASDAWTHGKGYRSMKDMQLIVYHKERGEISRTRIGVDSLT